MSIQVRSNEKPVPQPEVKTPEAEAAVPVDAKLSALGETTPEQEKPEVTETPEVEETEKPEGAEPKADSEPEGEDTEKPKKKGGFQRRIDKLNSRISQREQEIEYWKQQALKNASEPRKESPAQPSLPAAGVGKPKPDSFETHAEFVEALTDWKTDQKLMERDQRAEKSRLETEQSKMVNSYVERKNAFAEKTPDFDETLEEVSEIVISPAVRDIILTSENGPELAYQLAKRKEEYAAICRMRPLEAARAIGRIEVSLTKPSTPETKTLTKAPKPINPVVGGGKGTAPKSIYDPGLSQSEYERLRKAKK